MASKQQKIENKIKKYTEKSQEIEQELQDVYEKRNKNWEKINDLKQELKELDRKDSMPLGTKSKAKAQKIRCFQLVMFAGNNEPIIKYTDEDTDIVRIYLDRSNNILFEMFEDSDARGTMHTNLLYFDGINLHRWCEYENEWEEPDGYGYDTFWEQKESKIRAYAIEQKAIITIEKAISK